MKLRGGDMNSFIKLFILVSVIFFASCATNEVIKDPDKSDNEKAPETPKQFTRIFFDYEEMEQMPVMELDPEIVQIIDSAYDEITMNNSTRALATVEDLYRNQEAHPEITDIYAYCLFRNGHRFKALEIIDDAIKQFGPYGNLIYSRIIMSRELAETGLNMMQVDGNGIYNSSDLPYDEADFIKTNYQSALHDALYLFSQFDTDANLACHIGIYMN